MFMSRFFIVICLIGAFFLVTKVESRPILLFEIAFVVAAAVLFPMLFVRLWLPNCSEWTLLLSAFSGFSSICGFGFVMHLGPDLIASSGDEIIVSIPYITAQISNLGVGLIGFTISIVACFLLMAIQNYWVNLKERIHAAA